MPFQKPLIKSSLFIVIVIAIGYWQIALSQAIMKWDILDINLPWRYFVSECLHNGILPLWNPYISGGFPQTGDPMTWYPVSWVIGFLFGNDLMTLQYEYLLHVIMGGLGIYILLDLLHLRPSVRLATAIVYAFSGFFISNAQHFGWIISAAWLPYVIYFYVRLCQNKSLYYGLLFALFFFLLLSGGYPAFFVITAYILLAIFVFHCYRIRTRKTSLQKFLAIHCITVLIFILLSSVVLVSSFELSRYIVQKDKFTLDFVLSQPLPYQAMISFLFPYATTGNVDFYGSDFSMVNCFIGIFTLILLIYSVCIKNRKALLFIVIGLFFLSAALTDIFPTRKILFYLPFMNSFRFPAVFRLFTCICFMLAAAIGLNHYRNSEEKRNKKFILSVGIVTILILLFFVLHYSLAEKWKFLNILRFDFAVFDRIAGFHERIILQSLVHGVLLTILIVFYFLHTSANRFYKALLALLIIDLVISTQLNIYQTVIHHVNPKPTQASVNNLPKGFPLPNLNVGMNEITENSNPAIPCLWRNMNIFYKNPTFSGYTPYYLRSFVRAENSDIYKTIILHPVAFFTDKLDPIQVPDTNNVDTKTLQIRTFRPGKIQLEAGIEKSCYLVLLQNKYPGWIAHINGKKAPIMLTGYSFMSVWLPPGKSTISFDYQPKHIIAALCISVITLISVMVLLLYFAIKKWKY